MKTLEITGKSRDGIGKVDSKNLRREGMIPAVIYGGADVAHVAIKKYDINKALNTPETHIITVNVDGKSLTTILRDAQFHPLTDEVIHVDLFEVNDEKPITLMLPIRLNGTAKGVLNGGRLVQLVRKLKVVGVPGSLPDFVDIDITKLGLGKTIKVKDIDFGDLRVVTPGPAGIAMVDIPRSAKMAGAVLDEDEEEDEEGGEESAE